MVTLVVATTIDPTSNNPANVLLNMPGRTPSLRSFQGMRNYCNGRVRLILHDSRIIDKDHLDVRWHQQSGAVVDKLIFLRRHTAVSNRPALNAYPIGVPHLREGEVPRQGGKPGWAAPPNPRIGPWLRLLQGLGESRNLFPEFEITLEGTHHGPETNKPALFLEIGSLDEHWKRPEAAQVIAQVETILPVFTLDSCIVLAPIQERGKLHLLVHVLIVMLMKLKLGGEAGGNSFCYAIS